MAKCATSYARISSPLSRSDLHSAVQPSENALANQARTTACFPRKLARRYSLPSEPGSEKSGAASPTINARTRGGLAGMDPPRSGAGDPQDAPAMQATVIEAYTQRIQPFRIHRTIPRGDRTPRAPRRPESSSGSL